MTGDAVTTMDQGLLVDVRVYLSGPMDFVASRAAEKATGWRNRVGEFLRSKGATVFDPWDKPDVRGMHEYGKEGETTTSERAKWTYAPDADGARARESVASSFWPALHIDLRMVDTSDFIVCFCPTNIYSVGTPHEIILARQQRKPVLFVSPYVTFPALQHLREHLAADRKGKRLLEDLVGEVPIKENLNASPSLWYLPLVGGERFFDGFGFEAYRSQFGWPETPFDANERVHPPKKPLLPFLEELDHRLPVKWDRHTGQFVPDDDWLLWDLREGGGGAGVCDAKRR